MTVSELIAALQQLPSTNEVFATGVDGEVYPLTAPIASCWVDDNAEPYDAVFIHWFPEQVGYQHTLDDED